ncbi:islet cell autoantigen 1 isoform X2 [Cimex lectularius]|uniref:AH domain-containing protein n=1 Tax=Cimex lectularius TaxID=79782 RepID=A0A8I6RD52_CIMLE|nr:islet cell autoantigen 1 isoform X2 [Cimex lectularius]
MNESSASWSYGYGDGGYMRSGSLGWNDPNQRNNSAIAKMQHQYWVTKETVFRKLGKKEDVNIVASDAELDAKLELFRSIQDSCFELQRIIDKYQERICILAQEENSMGRFLKDAGKHDKTGAGQVMMTLGKNLSHSGQQRISLRNPLLRLFQEVDTFRHRAIEDTGRTVQSMEKTRTEYRACLSWMKDISQELDPDTYKQLEKFRKVQDMVKQSKAIFDRYKLDCLQKVDLLAAARCNMFSHALILYHNVMLQFATQSAQAFSSIAASCKDHPKFEFSVVKELSEMKPDETASPKKESQDSDDKHIFSRLLNFEDAETENNDEQKKDDVNLLIEPLQDETGHFMPSQLLLQGNSSLLGHFEGLSSETSSADSSTKAPKGTSDGSKSWLELFSELDPLSNPDMIGQVASTDPLRNC